jgi:hypothetical protein
MVRAAMAAAMLLTVVGGAARAQGGAAYDAGLGTLPTAQGWSLTQTGSVPASAPAVSGGALNQGPTTVDGVQLWQRTDVPLDFTQGFTLDWSLSVISSTYGTGGAGPRAGWNVTALDSARRFVSVGFATRSGTDGVYINTDGGVTMAGAAFQALSFSQLRDYRLTISGGTIRLFVDGGASPIATAVLGSSIGAGTANQVRFGDESTVTQSQTQLRSLSYAAAAVVPEPGAGALLAAGAALLVPAVRRNRPKHRER